MNQALHSQTAAKTRAMLLVRAAEWYAALPVRDLAETCRPLPLRPLDGVPPYVRGVTVLRGKSTPVVSLMGLLGGGPVAPGKRLVSVRLEAGVVALEVDEVLGVHDLAYAELDQSRPLVSGEALERLLGTLVLDERLVAWLETSRLLPDDVLDLLFAERMA